MDKYSVSLLLRSPLKSSERHYGSVLYAHTDYDEHRVILFRAACFALAGEQKPSTVAGV